MGKNTPERQEFIIDNLVVEKNDEELALIKEAESQQEVVA
jgi:topoisomerase-4 subunit B